MKLKIRKATIKDIDQIYNVFLDMVRSEDAAMRKSSRHLMRFRKKRNDFTSSSKRGLREELKAKNSLYLVAVVGDKIVGYARGEVLYSQNFFFQREKTGRLHALAVLKKYRGHKIASQLHNEMENWFKKKQCLQMNLTVIKDNPAVKIYEKWGYKTFVYKMSKKI